MKLEKDFIKTFISESVLGFTNNFVSKIPLFFVRHTFYTNVLRLKKHPTATIGMNNIFFSPWKITIGEGTRIHFGCILDGRCGLQIGSHCDISFGVRIFTLQHDIDNPSYNSKGGKVTIGNYSCIETGSIILPGITIGEGAVVAAGAVVTKDVPPYTLVGGVPAKFIRQRNKELAYTLGAARLFH